MEAAGGGRGGGGGQRGEGVAEWEVGLLVRYP